LQGQLSRLSLDADAMDFALLAFRQPGFQLEPASFAELSDVLSVLKAAAGDSETLDHLSIYKNAMPDQLQIAAQFCLTHVISASARDPRQALVLSELSGEKDIRDHKRWLLKWLHPDRNSKKWESNLFAVVQDAADQLLDGEPHVANVKIKSDGLDHQWVHARQRKRIVEPSAALRRAFKLVAFVVVLVVGLVMAYQFIAPDYNFLG
jgi:hypothetical protein